MRAMTDYTNDTPPELEPPEILRFFAYAHLPERLQLVSRPFGQLAELIVDMIPVESAERDAGLRKLLEAKDAIVRAALDG